MLLHIIVIHYPHLSYTLSPEIKDPENRACLVTIILETAHALWTPSWTAVHGKMHLTSIPFPPCLTSLSPSQHSVAFLGRFFCLV